MDASLTTTSRDLISRIDISKETRLLRILRLTDYALVIMCWFWFVGTLEELWNGGGILVVVRGALLVLTMGVGWKHLGKVDLYFWQSHLFALAMLVALCVFEISTLLPYLMEIGLPDPRWNEVRAQEFGQNGSYVIKTFWVGLVALLGAVCLFGLRVRRTNYKDLKLFDMLVKVTPRNPVEKRVRFGVSRVDLPMGVVTGLVGVGILTGLALIPLPYGPQALRCLSMSLTAGGFAFYLLIQSRKFLQLNVESLLSVDKRKPILFLRSFDDDEKEVYEKSKKSFLDFSLESRLATHFAHTGPFITVGSPRDELPLPGAARALLTDDNWQTQIERWIREASLILLYAGKTHWLNWELKKVIDVGQVRNLLMMTPENIRSESPSAISARIDNLRSAFDGTVWAPALSAVTNLRELRAVVFRPGGAIIVITSHLANRDSWHLAGLIGHYVLQEPEPSWNDEQALLT